MRRHVLLFACVAMALQGCNCVGREFTRSQTFSVHAEATDPLCSKEFYEVNLGQDETFMSVRQFISRVEVREVWVAVNNPKTREDSLATMAHGTVVVSSEKEGGESLVLGTYSDVKIAADVRQQIALDKEGSKLLSKLALRAPYHFWVVAEGCNDKVPAFYDFDVILTFYAGL